MSRYSRRERGLIALRMGDVLAWSTPHRYEIIGAWEDMDLTDEERVLTRQMHALTPALNTLKARCDDYYERVTERHGEGWTPVDLDMDEWAEMDELSKGLMYVQRTFDEITKKMVPLGLIIPKQAVVPGTTLVDG